MDIFSNLALGFTTTLQPTNLLFCFVGCLLGTVIGVLPGIGPLSTIAILLLGETGVGKEVAARFVREGPIAGVLNT